MADRRLNLNSLAFLSLLLLFSIASAKVFFEERFEATKFGNRKPKLALAFADLLVDPQQILMVTVAATLRAISYEFQVLF
ncbi:hypothetical protein L1987_18628 [Smallanthus sonchifolius]|uniref:Uncharacterized protein n=1 Tax=Smallanthus sonchifolius TaxID=185202 RepID=A0ACB9J099_9ASTR|nr:hypothetical protein L1987_18628 [Smallanthus sonchifolius]